jgi:hypothetical protein
MKLAARYFPPILSHLGNHPAEIQFKNTFEVSLNQNTNAEGYLTPEGIFEIACQTHEMINTIKLTADKNDSFSLVLFRLARQIGFDVLNAAGNAKDAGGFYPFTQFKSALTSIDATRIRYEALLSRLKNAQSHAVNLYETQLIILKETLAKNTQDTHTSKPIATELKAEIAIIEERLEQLENFMLEAKDKFNIDLTTCKSVCHQFLKFTTHYKEINTVSANLIALLSNIYPQPESSIKKIKDAQAKLFNHLGYSVNNSSSTHSAIPVRMPLRPSAPLEEEKKYTSHISKLLAQIDEDKLTDIPEGFTCPIHLHIMVEPVVGSDGQHYDEESAISVVNAGNPSHRTGQPVTQYLKDQDLKTRIIVYLEIKIRELSTLTSTKESKTLINATSALIRQSPISSSPVFTDRKTTATQPTKTDKKVLTTQNKIK